MKKLQVDTHPLSCAQEELAVKKQLLEQVGKMDQRYAENMDKMSQTTEKLTNSIADEFHSVTANDDLPTASTNVSPTNQQNFCHARIELIWHVELSSKLSSE